MHAFHPEQVGERRAQQYRIGRLRPTAAHPTAKHPVEEGYTQLHERLLRDGLFESRPWWFAAVFCRNSLLLVAAWLAVLYGGSLGDEGDAEAVEWYGYWVQAVLGGLLLGTYWQQAAFLGHDLGHTAVT